MSLKFWFCIMVGMAASASFASAQAQTVSEKGMATINYSGWSLGSNERREALAKAQANALERYVANTNSAKAQIFESKRSQIFAHIGDYILGSTVLSKSQDKDAKTYTVVVRADINTTRLMNDLGTGASSQAVTATQTHSLMTFLFVARSQSSVQSFDDKVYKRADAGASNTRTTNEGESIHKHDVGTSEHVEEHASLTMTTGGSVTRKANKVGWTTTNAAGVDTAMTGVFSNAGYQVVAAGQVQGASNGLLDIKAIRKAYSTGNGIPPKTMYRATQGVRTAGIDYFAIGTLDVGLASRDPVSGNVRVFVTVTGKVLNVKGRFARTLVSIGPVQYAGLGPNPKVARTNALKNAATKSARKMVDELTNKGIH